MAVFLTWDPDRAGEGENPMIMGIIGCKVKEGENIITALGKLKTYARTYPGCLGAENLVNERDGSIVAMVSTWRDAEHWRQWEDSEITRTLLAEARASLAEEPRVTAYRMIPIDWG